MSPNPPPVSFQSELKRKAESAGGSFTASTQKRHYLQTHLTGARIKKSLSEASAYATPVAVMHRDLFSAFLARYVDEISCFGQDALAAYPGNSYPARGMAVLITIR